MKTVCRKVLCLSEALILLCLSFSSCAGGGKKGTETGDIAGTAGVTDTVSDRSETTGEDSSAVTFDTGNAEASETTGETDPVPDTTTAADTTEVTETTAPGTTAPVTEKEKEKEKEKEVFCKSIRNLRFAAGPRDNALCYVTPLNKTVFLSAAADVGALQVEFDGEGYLEYEKTGTGKKNRVYSGGKIDISGMTNSGENGSPCFKVSFRSSGETLDLTFYRGSVSSMYLQTGSGLSRLQANKELRDKDTRAVYVNGQGKIEYNDLSEETFCELKCRGNSSFNDLKKKPYQIKLGKKTGLAGMKKAKTWILLSGAYDGSMLRNAAATAIANALSMPYTPSFAYVDLFIDGQYQGLYILTEKVQIGNNRIEIASLEDENEEINDGIDLSAISDVEEKNPGKSWLTYFWYVPLPKQPADITGGYLIEIDNLYYQAEASVIKTHSGNHYVVKSPEYASYDETAYIGGLIGEMEEALYSSNGYNSYGRHYSEYIDVQSLADVYLVREIMKDWDGFNGSTYFYKDADVNGITSELKLGPIWDFDICLDNNTTERYYLDSTLWCQSENEPAGTARKFGKYIMIHPEMKMLTAERFAIAGKKAAEICTQGSYLDQLKNSLLLSNAMERLRWPERIFGYPFSDGTDNDESTHTGQVKSRLASRVKVLTPLLGEYALSKSYYTVTLSPELEGKVELCCSYYKGGVRAAVRLVSDPDLSLIASFSDGSTIDLKKSSTGSLYENGILTFTMPEADVVIRGSAE